MTIDRRVMPTLRRLILAAGLLVTACAPQTPPPVTPTAEPVVPTPAPTATQAVDILQPGIAQREAGNLKAAEASLRLVVAQHPESARARSEYAAVLMDTGVISAALEQARAAQALDPDERGAWSVLTRASLADGNISEALIWAEKAVQADPADGSALANLALVYLANNQFDKARDTVEEAHQRHPDTEAVLVALGQVHAALGDYGRAGLAFERAVASHPSSLLSALAQAAFLADTGKVDRARAAYTQAAGRWPDSPNPWLGLARLSGRAHQSSQADQELGQARQRAPGYVWADFTEAALRADKRDSDAAIEAIRAAEKKGASAESVAFALGGIYLSRQECEAAARQFDRALALSPRESAAFAGAGFARLCAGDSTRAAEAFRRAIQLDPYSGRGHLGLALSLAQQGRRDDAAASLARAITLLPWRAEAHLQASLIASDSDGLSEIALANTLDPDLVEGRIALAHFALDSGAFGDAERHARSALAMQPDQEDAQRILGGALAFLGRADEAKSLLQPLAAKRPEDADARYFLGIAYTGLGSFPQAARELEAYQGLVRADRTRAAAQNYPVARLINDLKAGYFVAEKAGLKQLSDEFAAYAGSTARFVVGARRAGGGESRVLTATLDLGPQYGTDAKALDEGLYLVEDILDYAPRLSPRLDDGFVVVVRRAGRVLLTLSMGGSAARLHALGGARAAPIAANLAIARQVDPQAQPIASIQDNAAALRELPQVRGVKVTALSPDEMTRKLTTAPDAQEREAGARSAAVLRLLGVITSETALDDLNDQAARQIAGVYFPSEKAFYVVKTATQDAYFDIVVAHEHIHALQDASFDLDAREKACPNGDACRALRALIEGDATYGMYEYAREYVAAVDLRIAQSRAALNERDITRASRTLPDYFYGVGSFPYNEGYDFVSNLKASGGWAAVSAAFGRPPASTEQVLHPEKYRENEAPLQVDLPNLAASLGGGWKRLEEDTLGELGLRLILAEAIGPVAAGEAARGWGGDRYQLLRRGDEGPLAIVIRTRWDSPEDADEFVALYRVAAADRDGFAEQATALTGALASRTWVSTRATLRVTRTAAGVDVYISEDPTAIPAFETALR